MTNVSTTTRAVMESVNALEASAREARSLEVSEARKANQPKMEILADLTTWLLKHKLGRWRKVWFRVPTDEHVRLHVILTYRQSHGWLLRAWETCSDMDDYDSFFDGHMIGVSSAEAQVFLAEYTTAEAFMRAWIKLAQEKKLDLPISV